MSVPDHPEIRNAERYGYPYGEAIPPVHCPVCGKECETVYIDRLSREAVGCDCCIESLTAEEYTE